MVLLTDGLPNCRDANPVNVCDCGDTCSTARITACASTQSSCTGAARCHIACLDQGGAVENVAALKEKGIRTIVVGFGAEVSRGKGPEVLNAMAEVGGFARAHLGGDQPEALRVRARREAQRPALPRGGHRREAVAGRG